MEQKSPEKVEKAASVKSDTWSIKSLPFFSDKKDKDAESVIAGNGY